MEKSTDIFDVLMRDISGWFKIILAWFQENVFIISTLYQFAATIFAFLIAYYVAKRYGKRVQEYKWKWVRAGQYHLLDSAKTLVLPAVWCVVQWLIVLISPEVGGQTYFTAVVAKLVTAWIVIRFTTGFVTQGALSRAIAVIVWSLAALSIVNLLEPTLNILDKLALDVGELHLSVLSIVKGIFTIAIMLWAAMSLSRMIESRIQSYSDLEPSARVLFSKLSKVTFIVLAVFFGFSSMGIDMSAIAVFGGAIGVGIGFGLQKVVSNLICGVILLIDRSIKPGDVIALSNGKTFGWVNKLSARCVSIKTRDGDEHLIPNEDFITQKVENWSYSDRKMRIKIPVGVAYDSDVNKALALLVESAKGVKRVLDNPEAVSRMVRFGDSAIELELRIWIQDPEKGVVNVQSEVLLNIWNSFKENKINIPFPQRDLHIKSSALKKFA